MPYLGYPEIPLHGFWGDTQSFKLKPVELSTAEGSLTSRGPRNRINKSSHTWSISGNIKNGIEVDTFLKSRLNQPFAYSFEGTPATFQLYTCNDYTLSIQAYVEQSDYQIWAFKATFNQVYRAGI